jgi:hypothetical protein
VKCVYLECKCVCRKECMYERVCMCGKLEGGVE